MRLSLAAQLIPRRSILLLQLLVILFVPTPPGSWAGPTAESTRPNIVVLLADDMNADDLTVMPRTLERVAQQGATFDAFYSNVSLCGPSRATFLTGRYTQNTRVKTNYHSQYIAGGNEYANVGYWLKKAGYRTALIGKYINSYPDPMPAGYVPPGWSVWFALQGKGETIYTQYNYEVDENGRIRTFGSAPYQYGTDVLGNRAVQFIRRATADHVPYFCYLAFSAPHAPSTPAPRHATLFAKTPLPQPPSYNEADLSDKPSFLQSLPLLTLPRYQSLRDQYRNRLRSLQAVDEAVNKVLGSIGDEGLANTYVIFASDNGYLFGQHRATGKSGPYEEMIHMPLLIRGPGIESRSVIRTLVGNADIVPTILAWTQVGIADDLDGRSFAGLLNGQAPERWRIGYPLGLQGTTNLLYPKYVGFRTQRYTYALYATGESEFYDMLVDPYQLNNLAATLPPETLASYAGVARELGTCKGSGCRLLDMDTRLPE